MSDDPFRGSVPDAGDPGPDRTDLTFVTESEKLRLWRYRQSRTDVGISRPVGRGGYALSQPDAAEILDVTIADLRDAEAGWEPKGEGALEKIRLAIAEIDPSLPELCMLARWRSGESLDDVSTAVGASRPHLLLLERTADPRVVRFWESREFRFPADMVACLIA